MQPIAMPVHRIDDLEPAVKSFTRDPNGGLVVLSDVFNVVNRELIIGLAAQYRLPAIYFFQFSLPMADWCPTGSTGATHFAEPLHS